MPGTFDAEDVADVAAASKTNLPYPSFSKAHSREIVSKQRIPSPEPTETEGKQHATNGGSHHHKSPPSPPLTNVDLRKGSLHNEDERLFKHHPKTKVRIKKPAPPAVVADEPTRVDSPKLRGGVNSKSTAENIPPPSSRTPPGKSTVAALFEQLRSPKRSSSHGNNPAMPNGPPLPPRDETATINNNGATPKPMTPPVNPASRNRSRSAGMVSGVFDYGRSPSAAAAAAGGVYATMPPQPPEPPSIPPAPKVDYLLRLGGLDERAPRSLLRAGHVYSEAPSQALAASVFEPFNHVLGDYQKVMAKNGSLAVATGYRSVARRLLDRLEAVFARDISSESCYCVMCESSGREEQPSGVSWGEILELVSGRKELPRWPPFSMAPSAVDPAWNLGEEHVPMQKLDIDVPEEFREYFVRQSLKTKVAVDRWLSEQSEQATTAKPLDDLDDETLTFAMLTRLNRPQRQILCELLGVPPTTAAYWAPQNGQNGRVVRPAILVASSVAIERLYRLPAAPRDAETAMYMLRNPDIHHVLATIAAISDDEWDILVSGRFDGFLRSGAESDLPATAAARPGSTPPRWGTPMSAATNNTTTAATTNRAEPSMGPIALDEETEIAALSEIERDIFVGMEALEDAFEALHQRAELVRRALRERGTGLSAANHSRRGAYAEARTGTPAVVPVMNRPDGLEGGGGPDDDWLDDGRSLYPDDSASNVSSSRRRRPKRRSERRTPAGTILEEEEEDAKMYYGSRRGYGRRK